MCKKNDDSLLFVCSLIEYIGRQTRQSRSEIIKVLGKKELQRLYDYADVLHSEPIEKVAQQCIAENGIQTGTYDNVESCNFLVPSAFDIGKVYERLIEDASAEESPIDTLMHVYGSPLSDAISDYNRAVYYQPREYLAACYQAGQIL